MLIEDAGARPPHLKRGSCGWVAQNDCFGFRLDFAVFAKTLPGYWRARGRKRAVDGRQQADILQEGGCRKQAANSRQQNQAWETVWRPKLSPRACKILPNCTQERPRAPKLSARAAKMSPRRVQEQFFCDFLVNFCEFLVNCCGFAIFWRFRVAKRGPRGAQEEQKPAKKESKSV